MGNEHEEDQGYVLAVSLTLGTMSADVGVVVVVREALDLGERGPRVGLARGDGLGLARGDDVGLARGDGVRLVRGDGVGLTGSGSRPASVSLGPPTRVAPSLTEESDACEAALPLFALLAKLSLSSSPHSLEQSDSPHTWTKPSSHSSSLSSPFSAPTLSTSSISTALSALASSALASSAPTVPVSLVRSTGLSSVPTAGAAVGTDMSGLAGSSALLAAWSLGFNGCAARRRPPRARRGRRCDVMRGSETDPRPKSVKRAVRRLVWVGAGAARRGGDSGAEWQWPWQSHP
jgi:hypothetical protein